MENSYYKKLIQFKTELENDIKTIFKIYKNELTLKLEDLNLLKDKYNVIESSTAIGFLIEEFLSVKLNNLNEKIARISSGTATSAYDLYYFFDDNLKILINVKVEKSKGGNNAISAINKLYNDYCKIGQNKELGYLILKIIYEIKNEKIQILDFDLHYLEEYDWSQNYNKDKRNWSDNYNPNSGRLLITPSFKKQHSKEIKDISYQITRNEIENIYFENQSKIQQRIE